MNIRDFKYLLAVADLRHFGRAAEKCFVSQPTLSAQLKKLSDQLGVKLFEWNGRQLIITPIGEKIVTQARVIIREIEMIQQIASSAVDPFLDVFRLGIIPTLGPYLLPKILLPLKRAYPQLRLTVMENKTHIILQQLRHGELDAIILAMPVDTQGLSIENLFIEPFYVAMSKTYPLVKNHEIAIMDIQPQDLLLLEEGHCLRDQALEACSLRQKIPAEYEFQATSLETLRHLVAADTGITLLPALCVDQLNDSDLVIKPFAKPIPSREVALLCRNSCVREECVRAIAETVRKAVKAVRYLKTRSKRQPMQQLID